MNDDLPTYQETRAALLIDPDRPITLEYRSPGAGRVDWFSDVTDVNATQLMPAVTPSPTSRHAA